MQWSFYWMSYYYEYSPIATSYSTMASLTQYVTDIVYNMLYFLYRTMFWYNLVTCTAVVDCILVVVCWTGVRVLHGFFDEALASYTILSVVNHLDSTFEDVWSHTFLSSSCSGALEVMCCPGAVWSLYPSSYPHYSQTPYFTSPLVVAHFP